MKNYLVKTGEEEMYVEAVDKDHCIEIVLSLQGDVYYDEGTLEIKEVECNY